MVTSAVYARFGPDKWVTAIRKDMNAQFDFVVDDPELPELGAVSIPMQSASLHPMAYVTDKGAAVSWAQFLANESPFLGSTLQTATVNIGEWGAVWVLTTTGIGAEEVFVEFEVASIQEYRNAIEAGAGIVEESITADGYTIIDGNGNTHLLMSVDNLSCGDKCEKKRDEAVRHAEDAFEDDVAVCDDKHEDDMKDLDSTAANCCVVGGAIGGAVGGVTSGGIGVAVGTGYGCALAALICLTGRNVKAYNKWSVCFDQAFATKQAAVLAAQDAWAACCADCEDEDDPACHPGY